MLDRPLVWIATITAIVGSLLFAYHQPSQPARTKNNSVKAMAAVDLLKRELANGTDPSSFAEPHKHRVQHMHLQWRIDFVQHVLVGHNVLTVKRIDPKATHLVLDTHNLNISAVHWLNGTNEVALPNQVHPEVPDFGSKFEIDVSQVNGEVFKVKVDYTTTKESVGLQWMTPEMTNGKKQPFMFSQFEAISARSALPCQDTPAVKAPYTAEVEAPAAVVPLMSAKIEKPATAKGTEAKVHYFNQPIPVPSYLVAIACGDLDGRKLGPRSTVWAERGVVEKAAWEFADLDKILKTAEDLAGPYEWGEYNLLVLPPSFPFGGMENPCMTFVTPTLLAGDRSLVYVVAHEISHSWTGNLVTNANFEHFWLNEGFTTFLERKIVGKIGRGEPSRQFAAIEGLKELNNTIKEMGATNPLTDLVVDLRTRGVSPDEAFSIIPYEKGHVFLFYLEKLVGGPSVFEPFLRAYIHKFRLQSIVTDDFKGFLLEYFKDTKAKELAQIDWNKWLSTPGAPPVIPDYDRSLLLESSKLAEKWIKATDNGTSLSAEEFKALSSPQQKLFLLELIEQVDKNDGTFGPEKVAVMVDKYQLKKVINSEVRCSWLTLGLKAHFEGAIQEAVKFVSEQGRMKYLEPMYRGLFTWPKTKQLALDTFEANKPNMMKIAVEKVAAILKIKP